MTIAPYKIRAILVALKAMGISPDELLAGSGASWRAIRQLNPISIDEHARIFDVIVTKLPSDAAIRCGRLTHLRDFGVAGNAMVLCPTVGEALSFWARYSRLSNHVLLSDLRLGPVWGEFRLVPNIPLSTPALLFCIAYSVASLSATYRQLTGTDAPALTIVVPRGLKLAPWHLAFDVKALAVNDRLSASLKMPRADFDRAVISSDPSSLEPIAAGCARNMALLDELDILDRIGAVIGASQNIPSLAEVAHSLGMTSMALQKRLKAEGRSYFEMVEGHRRERARSLFNDGTRLRKEISHSLGYGSGGSLRRAIVRWSAGDHTPTAADASRHAPHK